MPDPPDPAGVRTQSPADLDPVALEQGRSDRGVIDTVIGEPGEGAHEDPEETAKRLGEAIEAQIDEGLQVEWPHDDFDADFVSVAGICIFNKTRVPSPGSLSITSSPPICSARSCMMVRPICSPGWFEAAG